MAVDESHSTFTFIIQRWQLIIRFIEWPATTYHNHHPHQHRPFTTSHSSFDGRRFGAYHSSDTQTHDTHTHGETVSKRVPYTEHTWFSRITDFLSQPRVGVGTKWMKGRQNPPYSSFAIRELWSNFRAMHFERNGKRPKSFCVFTHTQAEVEPVDLVFFSRILCGNATALTSTYTTKTKKKKKLERRKKNFFANIVRSISCAQQRLHRNSSELLNWKWRRRRKPQPHENN